MCDSAPETKISESTVFSLWPLWSDHDKMTCLRDWHGNQIAQHRFLVTCCLGGRGLGKGVAQRGPFRLAGRRCFLSFSLLVLCAGPSADAARPRSAYQCRAFHRRADWCLPGPTLRAFNTVSITLCLKAELWKRRCFCRYQEAERTSVLHRRVIDWWLVMTLCLRAERGSAKDAGPLQMQWRGFPTLRTLSGRIFAPQLYNHFPLTCDLIARHLTLSAGLSGCTARG